MPSPVAFADDEYRDAAEVFADKQFHPAALVRLSLLLDDFGQEEPERLIQVQAVPLSFSIEQNSHMEADTAEVEFNLDGFPTDPRIFRGATVEVLLDQLPAPDAAHWDGLTTEELGERVAFIGIADEITVKLERTGFRTRLRCRDYTAYFLDVQATAALAEISFVRSGRKLSLRDVLEDILRPPGDDAETTARRTRTQAIEIDDPDDLASQVFPADFVSREKSTTKEPSRKARQGESVWEQVQSLAALSGLIVYIDLDKLKVRKPDTLFDASGDVQGEVVVPATWTLGHNVSGYELTRRLSRQTGLFVEVRCYVPELKKVLVGIWPSDFEVQSRMRADIAASPVLDDSDKEALLRSVAIRQVYRVTNITSEAQLQEIARQHWEQLRHHEFEVSVETAQMRDTNGRLATTVRYGDPVVVDLARSLQSTVTLSPEAQVRALVTAGWSREDAERVALDVSQLTVPYYLSRAIHRYGNNPGDGYALTLQLRARSQVEIADEAAGG